MKKKKKEYIDLIAITPKKANAQNFTCFITFLVTSLLTIVTMIVACVLPAVASEVTETICWISMALEAISLVLGIVSYWIKRNAL